MNCYEMIIMSVWSEIFEAAEQNSRPTGQDDIFKWLCQE